MSSIAFPPDDTTTAVPAPATPTPTDTDLIAARAARNRANAQKSTGPRTREGKARAAQNARTHGLSADGALSTTPAAIPRDLAADPTFQLAKQELTDEFRPVTPMQKVLVSQLAHLTWKLDQIPKFERQLLATPLGSTTPTPLPPPTRVSDNHDDARDDAPTPPDPTSELTVQHLLQNEPTPLTRLWDHHRRLLGRIQSLLRQLFQLQKEERRRADEDNDVESARDRSRRRAADHAADHAVIDQTLDAMRARHRAEREHRDHATQPAPAPNEQNEPTRPPSSPDLRALAPWSSVTVAPRNAVQPPPPAQNEPTPHGATELARNASRPDLASKLSAIPESGR